MDPDPKNQKIGHLNFSSLQILSIKLRRLITLFTGSFLPEQLRFSQMYKSNKGAKIFFLSFLAEFKKKEKVKKSGKF